MEKIEQKLNEFENKIQTLNDQDLVKQMQVLLDREKRLGDAILLALREIRTRRIDAAMGYASLFEMLVKYFKLSESSAYTRLQALKLMDAVPGVQESLVSGELSLSNAALVQQFIQQNEKETNSSLSVEDKNEIIDRVKNKSSREAKNELANRNPQFGLPPEKEKPLPLKYTQVQMNLDAETMSQLNEVKALLSHKIPNGNLKEIFKYMLNLTTTTLKKRKGQEISKDSVSSGESIVTTKNLEDNQESLALVESKEVFPTVKEILASKQENTNLKDAPRNDEEALISKECLSSKKESADYNSAQYSTNTLRNNHYNRDEDTTSRFIQNKKFFLSESVLRHNITSGGTDVRGNKMSKTNIRDSNQNINSNTPTKESINSSKRNRYIPISVRRKVFQRAKGCCEFVGSEGKRCSSRHQLEFDHIISWSHGGENNESSLQILCRQHNQFRVKETHGFWYQKR